MQAALAGRRWRWILSLITDTEGHGALNRSRNLAARAGKWSATHRKTAIIGWLVFVVAAVMIGGAVGTKQIADEDLGTGSSKAADQTIEDAFPNQVTESVLVQSSDGAVATDPAFQSTSR